MKSAGKRNSGISTTSCCTSGGGGGSVGSASSTAGVQTLQVKGHKSADPAIISHAAVISIPMPAAVAWAPAQEVTPRLLIMSGSMSSGMGSMSAHESPPPLGVHTRQVTGHKSADPAIMAHASVISIPIPVAVVWAAAQDSTPKLFIVAGSMSSGMGSMSSQVSPPASGEAVVVAVAAARFAAHTPQASGQRSFTPAVASQEVGVACPHEVMPASVMGSVREAAGMGSMSAQQNSQLRAQRRRPSSPITEHNWRVDRFRCEAVGASAWQAEIPKDAIGYGKSAGAMACTSAHAQVRHVFGHAVSAPATIAQAC
mmetsp:Transcript_29534/g.75713  ORF Transcript_29534/g.75713 Transcript_29534/m.75713 type:complete len:313 (-) Transcript_29534:3579-4517(-)